MFCARNRNLFNKLAKTSVALLLLKSFGRQDAPNDAEHDLVSPSADGQEPPVPKHATDVHFIHVPRGGYNQSDGFQQCIKEITTRTKEKHLRNYTNPIPP